MRPAPEGSSTRANCKPSRSSGRKATPSIARRSIQAGFCGLEPSPRTRRTLEPARGRDAAGSAEGSPVEPVASFRGRKVAHPAEAITWLDDQAPGLAKTQMAPFGLVTLSGPMPSERSPWPPWADDRSRRPPGRRFGTDPSVRRRAFRSRQTTRSRLPVDRASPAAADGGSIHSARKWTMGVRWTLLALQKSP